MAVAVVVAAAVLGRVVAAVVVDLAVVEALLAVVVVVLTAAEVVVVAAAVEVLLMPLVPRLALRLLPSCWFPVLVVRHCWENLCQPQRLHSLRRNLRQLVLQNLRWRFLFHEDLDPGLR